MNLVMDQKLLNVSVCRCVFVLDHQFTPAMSHLMRKRKCDTTKYNKHLYNNMNLTSPPARITHQRKSGEAHDCGNFVMRQACQWMCVLCLFHILPPSLFRLSCINGGCVSEAERGDLWLAPSPSSTHLCCSCCLLSFSSSHTQTVTYRHALCWDLPKTSHKTSRMLWNMKFVFLLILFAHTQNMFYNFS